MDTLTSCFILPLVGLHGKGINEVYWADAETQVEHPHIFIVLVDEELKDKVRNNKYYRAEYEKTLDEEEVTVLMVAIPDEYVEDFKLFTKGKYSKMSKAYRSAIYKAYESNKRWLNRLKGIFERTKEQKEWCYQQFCATLEDGRLVHDAALHYEVMINDDLELWNSPINEIIKA